MRKPTKKTIMLVAPHLGGGTSRHVEEMANAWACQGYICLLLETHYTVGRLFKWNKEKAEFLGIVSWPYDENLLLNILTAADVRAIHYHHFLYMHEFYYRIPEKLNVPFYVTLHDYYVICPFINLTSSNNIYCGLPKSIECNRCLQENKDRLFSHLREGVNDICVWREKWQNLLLKAAVVFVPHYDVEKRLAYVMPKVKTSVLLNPEIVPVTLDTMMRKWNKAKRRVGVIGTIDDTKGAGIVLSVAKEIVINDLPIEIIVFGIIKNHRTKSYRSLTILGRYNEKKVYQQIVDNAIDFFIFPATAPETYSYTLTIPIRLGIPVLGTDIGAIGARINDNGWGEVYPYDSTPKYICDKILKFDYKKYALDKKNFIINNTFFPAANTLYGEKIDEITCIDRVLLVEYLNRLNKKIEYIDIKDVTLGDIKKLYNWGISYKALLQMINKIKIRYVFKRLKGMCESWLNNYR